MKLVCKCGHSELISIHKDGYEQVKFVCYKCRVKPAIQLDDRYGRTRIKLRSRSPTGRGKALKMP